MSIAGWAMAPTGIAYASGLDETTFLANDPADFDFFGNAVAISGNFLVVGAGADNDPRAGTNSGSVYVFLRSGNRWEQFQKLTASDAQANDQFGGSVSIWEDIIVVGAAFEDAGGGNAGAAYIFELVGNQWLQQQKLTGVGAESGDLFGDSVAVWGDTIVVGSPGDDEGGLLRGSASVYAQIGGTWVSLKKLSSTDGAPGDQFGDAVAAYTNTIIVGAGFANHSGAAAPGAAYIFVREGFNWIEQGKLIAPDAASNDRLGLAVGLHEDTAIAGAAFHNTLSMSDAGAAYVFVRDQEEWSFQQKLTASIPRPGDQFGFSVSVLDDTVMVGSPLDDDPNEGTDAGSVYLFERVDANWTQRQRLATPGRSGDQFGFSVMLENDQRLVGARLTDHSGLTDPGTASLFEGPLNLLPLAVDDAFTTTEGSTFSGSLLANNGNGPDSDPEGQALMVVAVNGDNTAVGPVTAIPSGALVTIDGSGAFSYDPNFQFESLALDETNLDAFAYTIEDESGGTDTAVAVATITGLNDPPVVQHVTLLTIEDGDPIDGSFDGDDIDSDDTPATLTYSILKQPKLGSASNNGDGTYSFDPLGDFQELALGEEAIVPFTYFATDVHGATSNAGAAIVTVTGINDAPIAVDDALTTDEDTVLVASVFDDNGLGADSDIDNGAELNVFEVDGDPSLVGVLIPLPSGGSVAIVENGTVVYNPEDALESLAASDMLIETVGYSIADGFGGMDSATVTIQVNGVNDLPIAQDDDLHTEEDSALAGNLLSDNGHGPDSDIDDGTTLLISQINGIDIGGAEQLTLPSGAILSIAAGGSFAYDPNQQFETLAAGEEALDSFEYTLDDGDGGSDLGIASITILGVNDPPIAFDDSFIIDEDTAFNSNLLDDNGSGADSDIDAGASISVIEVNGNAADIGMLVLLESGAELVVLDSGVFVYDTNDQFDSLSDTESATDGFTYTIADGEGGMASATATILIEGVNDKPRAFPDFFQTDEDSMIVGNVMEDNGEGADSDVDSDAVISVIAINGSDDKIGVPITLASGASLTIAPNGNFLYNPAGQFESLTIDQQAQDEFSYTIGDGAGGASSATVTILIDGVNDDPVPQDDLLQTDEDSPFNANLLVDNGSGPDTDPETPEQISIVAVNGSSENVGGLFELPSGAVLVVIENGVTVYDPDDQFESLAPGEVAVDEFEYTIADGQGGTETATVSIQISGVNDDPSPQDDAIHTDEDTIVEGNVLIDNGNGVDFDIDSKGPLIVTHVDNMPIDASVPLPSGGIVTMNANGDFSYDPNGQFDSLPVNGRGSDSFLYTIADSLGAMSSATVMLTIEGVNDPPSAAPDTLGTNEDTPVLGNVLMDNGNGPDSDIDGDAVSVIEVNGNPGLLGQQVTLRSGALLTLNANGVFQYDPNGQFEDLAGGETTADTFQYTIDDPGGATDVATVSIIVTGLNDSPGDANGDDVVDVADLVVLVLAWGECSGVCAADFNNDGFVDVSDLVLLVLNWS